jgi:hypothetical protein
MLHSRTCGGREIPMKPAFSTALTTMLFAFTARALPKDRHSNVSIKRAMLPGKRKGGKDQPMTRLQITTVSLLVATSVTLSACSQRVGDFTALSTKNIPFKYETSTVVEGEDCRWSILGVPLGLPNLKEATDNAIGSSGNALVNEVTYQTGWTVFFFGQTCFKVKGDLVTLK